ncbi:MAG: DUF4349 domain-containing protein [Archangium sp.]|nr:DUF4349 domain-containing protein [Archangium sp.]
MKTLLRRCGALFGCGLIFMSACGRAAPEAIPRVLIRGATLRALVDTFDGLEATLGQKVSALGGFTTSSELSDASLTVVFRVPAAKLELALSEVAALTRRVDTRQVRADDFTEEYVDLEAQRKNLTATRDRLLLLLEKATKVDDALEVNRGLTEVQGQLERLTGRIKFLEQGAALSTVTATFYPQTTTSLDGTDWRPLEVARVALRSLLSVVQFLASALIVLVVFAPLWGPPVWFIRRRGRR